MANEQRTLTANFTANASGFAAVANETIQKLRDLNTQVVENKQKIRETNAEMKTYQRELEQLKASTNNGARATEEERARMRELQDAIAQCRTNLGTYAAAQQRLQSEVRGVNRELDAQRDSAQSVTDAILSMGDVIKANLMSEAIKSGFHTITNGLKQAATYCYGVGTSFEAGMSQVEAISGASGESLEALTNKAKELGSTTKFTATEAAQAMNYMAMAGWDAEQMLAGIDGVIGLAAASGEDLGITADIVTDSLTAFRMKAEDVGHFADVLAAASANANTNVSMLGESFKYVAPLAGTMGYSIDETAEALGIMANSGVKASSAGTYLRTIITNLSQGVTISSAAFGEMEISAANADGSMKSLNEVLGELRQAFALMTEQEQASNAKIIAGQRAISGLLPLLNASEADINKLRGAIESCDGAAANMAETMQQNVAGKATILKSALEGLGIAIYEKFSGRIGESIDNITGKLDNLHEKVEDGALGDSLEGLADSVGNAAEELVDFAGDVLPDFIGGLTNLIGFLADFRKEIGAVLSAWLTYKAAFKAGNFLHDFVKGISGIVKAFKNLRTATETATTAQEAHNAAVAANPYALAAAAVAVLVGAIVELNSHLDDCNDNTQRLMSNVEEMKKLSEEYHDKAEELEDIAEEYDNITKSAKDTEEKTADLKDLQERLIADFGSEAEGIDLVTMAFSNQSDVLKTLNENLGDYEEKSKDWAQQGLNALESAESEGTAITFGNVFSGDQEARQWAEQNLKTFDFGRTVSGEATGLLWNFVPGGGIVNSLWNDTMYMNGTFEERAEDLRKLKEYLARHGRGGTDLYNQIITVLDQMETDAENKKYYQQILSSRIEGNDDEAADNNDKPGYEKGAENSKVANNKVANNMLARDGDAWSGGTSDDNEPEKTADELAEEYKTQKQLADDLYKVKEISAAEYSARLTALRDEYLTEGTHEWYEATKEIMSLTEKAANGIGDAADETADRIKAAFSVVKNEFQKLLNDIDNELEQHSRDKEDEEYQGKVDSLTNRLKYDRLDVYTRRSLEKELADVNENWDEVIFQRNIEDKKDILRDASAQVDAVLKASDVSAAVQAKWNSIISGMAAAQQISPGASGALGAVGGVANAAVYNITINGLNKTGDQIENELLKKISSKVV